MLGFDRWRTSASADFARFGRSGEELAFEQAPRKLVAALAHGSAPRKRLSGVSCCPLILR